MQTFAYRIHSNEVWFSTKSLNSDAHSLPSLACPGGGYSNSRRPKPTRDYFTTCGCAELLLLRRGDGRGGGVNAARCILVSSCYAGCGQGRTHWQQELNVQQPLRSDTMTAAQPALRQTLPSVYSSEVRARRAFQSRRLGKRLASVRACLSISLLIVIPDDRLAAAL